MRSEDFTPRDSLVSFLTAWAATQRRTFQTNKQSLENSVSNSNQRSPSTLPTLSQQASIGTLKDLDSDLVLACLDKLRAVGAGTDLGEQPGPLSTQQVDSILALASSGCPNYLVLTWLNSARHIGVHDSLFSANVVSNAQRTAVTPPFAPLRTSPNSTPRSSAGLTGPPSTYNDCTQASSNTPRTSLDQKSILLSTPSENSSTRRSDSSTSTNNHLHGCPVCPGNQYRTCDGWKRHMKEHETAFPCTRCRNGSVSGKSQSYTRQGSLANHLIKIHKLTGKDPQASAKTWRNTSHKKYFSCGFCVTFFKTITEQLNHIDNDHFKHDQHIRDWDSSKVIRGLLQQPRLVSTLERLPRPNHPARETLAWHRSDTTGLQLRLERSDEHPETLVAAAIRQSNWVSDQTDTIESLPALGVYVQYRQIPHEVPPSQHRNQPYPESYPIPMNANQPTATDALQERYPPARDWFHEANFDFGMPFTQRAIDPAQAECLRDPNVPPLENSGSTYTQFPTDWDNQWQYPQHSPSDSSTSQAFPKYVEQDSLYKTSSKSAESWPGASRTIPSDTTPKASASHLAYPLSFPSVDMTGKEDLVNLTVVNQQSAHLQDYAGVTSDDTILYPSNARTSRPDPRIKLQSHYDAKADLDFDMLERSMLDDKHTRSDWVTK